MKYPTDGKSRKIVENSLFHTDRMSTASPVPANGASWAEKRAKMIECADLNQLAGAGDP